MNITGRRSTQQSVSSPILDRARPANPQGQRRTVEGKIAADVCIDIVEGTFWTEKGEVINLVVRHAVFVGSTCINVS